MTEFPDTLPSPLRAGYGLNHVSPLQRTEMASGRARQRRRFTSVPTMAQVQWLFTQAQAQLFEGWFVHEISDGAVWFNVRLRTPMGLKPYEARFAGMYEGPELVGIADWRITAQLELRERQTASEDEMQFPLEIAYGEIFDRTMNSHWPDN